jgi:hypothetical protein
MHTDGTVPRPYTVRDMANISLAEHDETPPGNVGKS